MALFPYISSVAHYIKNNKLIKMKSQSIYFLITVKNNCSFFPDREEFIYFLILSHFLKNQNNKSLFSQRQKKNWVAMNIYIYSYNNS